MAVFRKRTPDGEAYTPNNDPGEEYTGTENVARMSRNQKARRGYYGRGAQHAEAVKSKKRGRS